MTDATAPLIGVRVLDLGHHLAGPLAGMLLADQGADVVKIDPPGGPKFRHAVNAMLNRGKRTVELDLKAKPGQATLGRLVSDAEILIENFSPGVMDRLGLSPARLRDLNPRLILLSLPGFAPDDPFGYGVKAWEGVIAAVTGQFTDIHAVRQAFGLDPVYTALPLASVYAAVHAATAAVLALSRDAKDGQGAHVVTPLANAAVSAMSSIYMKIEEQPERYEAPRLPTAVKLYALPAVRAYARARSSAQPKLLAAARQSYPALMTSYATADGALLYIFALDNPKITDAAIQALELEGEVEKLGLVREDAFTAGDRRDNLWEASNLSRASQAALRVAIADRIAKSTAGELEALLNGRGVPCATQRTTEEWLGLEPLREAGLVVEVNDPELGTTRQPGLQAWVSDSARDLVQPRPRLSSSDAGWGVRADAPAAVSGDTKRISPSEWLAGVTVLDLTSMVAGPVAGRTLAEYGARVIKIDAVRPNHGPRMTCWYGLDVNQGKESLLVNAKTPAGQELVQRWVERADVLLINHLPESLDRLGLGERKLGEVKPDLIVARVSAYDGPLGGPWADRHGYDPVLQAASGIMTRFGDPGHPELHAIASCVDALTGYSAAFGIALALKRRAEDGRGRTVGTSLAAAASLVQLPFAVAHEGRRWTEASGQSARGEGPLYRLYRARDGWLFLAAAERPLEQLGAVVGSKISAVDGEQAVERAIRRARLDDVLRRLAAAGMTAAPVRSVGELRALLGTGRCHAGPALVRAVVSGVGPVIQPAARQAWINGAPLRTGGSAPKPGADTERLAREVDLDPDALVAAGAAARELSRDYLPA